MRRNYFANTNASFACTKWRKSEAGVVCVTAFVTALDTNPDRKTPTSPISLSQYYLESRYTTWENLSSMYFTSKINS